MVIIRLISIFCFFCFCFFISNVGIPFSGCSRDMNTTKALQKHAGDKIPNQNIKLMVLIGEHKLIASLN